MGIDWKIELIGALRGRSAPGALTLGLLEDQIELLGHRVHKATLSRVVSKLENEGVFEKVKAGLWVNRLRFPQARLEEATQHLKAGAVISLRSVLGEYGVLNNISDEVSACVPYKEGVKGGLFTTSGNHSFYFRVLPPSFFPTDANSEQLLLDSSKPYPSFVPEKALLDWIHLARSVRSTLPPLPFDADLEGLDWDRLKDCADYLKMEIDCSSEASFAQFVDNERKRLTPTQTGSSEDVKERLRAKMRH